MPSTEINQLPYPAPADPADVPADLQALAERLDVLLPLIGSPIPWLVPTIPEGYLEFAGQAINAGAHPRLAALFGASMPDLRGLTLLGATGARPAGTQGGEEAVTLSGAQMPWHAHGGVTTWEGDHVHGVGDPGHSHTPDQADRYWATTTDSQLLGQTGANRYRFTDLRRDSGRSGTGIWIGGAGGHNHGIPAEGGSQPHNNMPPYRTVRWITVAG